MIKITADYIHIGTGEVLQNAVIVCEDKGQNKGKIVYIGNRNEFDFSELAYYHGHITPGFVNTHCHLELSHLKGIAKTGTGLIDFISQVVANRNHPQELIQEAIEQGEKEMIENGIVAVGDISNTTDTFAQKNKGNLRYYTFVEFFDLMQEKDTPAVYQRYKEVYDQIIDTPLHQKSAVPHAPYSVTQKLFQRLNQTNEHKKTISIHNQETVAENDFFLTGQGEFRRFYERIAHSLKDFKANIKTSIHYSMENMNPQHRTIFVHNTLTTQEDIKAAQKWSAEVYWATCPNANLYIENKLPDYRHFLAEKALMTIGTDSLTSNWQLSILEEMKTILKYQSYLDFSTVLQWATLNGAKALGMDETIGSISVGKTPGLVSINGIDPDFKLQKKTTATRII